jgi:hypothetical protein
MRKILLGMVAVAVALVFTSTPSFAAKKHHQIKKAPAAAETAPAVAPASEVASEPTKAKKHHVKASDFPEKGWHRGPYVAATVGMMQVTNDYHVVTGRPFDGKFDPAFGLIFGWDIADWIGPMLQINFATASDTVGDANGGNNGGAAYPSNPGVTFPVGTFPIESARQYVLDFGLYAKATLPYFTRAEWQPKMVKILPYAKLGGTAHAVFNNAPTNANKAGAFGAGPALGWHF